jgi:glycosyltransferase involved in cell wall biosynthesis
LKSPLIAINGRFLTQVVTGVQRYAIEIVSRLSNLQSHYQFVVLAPPGRLISEVPHLIQDNFPFGGHLWEQLRLPWLLKKMKAALLWCPGNTAPVITFGVPMILSLLDAAPFSGPEWFSPQFRIYYRILMPLVGRTAIKIITISGFSRNELIKYNLAGKNENIAVVYCGIIPLRARRGELAKRMQLQNKKYVLCLGSRDPRKNIPRLLAAWDNIPDKIMNGRVLAIAGKADKIFSKEEFPTIPKGVLFLGYVPDDQLFDLYSGAEAFVFPSLYEGFGLPPL